MAKDQVKLLNLFCVSREGFTTAHHVLETPTARIKNASQWPGALPGSALINPHNPMKEQSEKQKRSKSPLNGYRKPHHDQDGYKWCSCTIPVLISPIDKGMAYCLRCDSNYYH